MNDLPSFWWTSFSNYLASATALLGGTFTPLSLLAAVGVVGLVVGVALAIAWREPKALKLAFPLSLALLTPVVLALSNSVLSWMGTGFSLFAGGLILVLFVALIARDATRRLPVWLIGLFIFSFAIWTSLATVAQIIATT